MTQSIIRSVRLLALFPLAALAAEPVERPTVLPAPVAAAVAAGDCEQLIALNRRYHAEPAAAPRAAVAALEDAILALPRCGTESAALVRVEPLSGVTFFDHRRPLGAPGR